MKNIFIIGRSAIICLNLSNILKKEGYKVSFVITNDCSKGFFKIKEKNPDMIICEAQLTAGKDIITCWEHSGLLVEQPLIVSSTDASIKYKDYCKKQGVSGFLEKPFTAESVVELVTKLNSNLWFEKPS